MKLTKKLIYATAAAALAFASINASAQIGGGGIEASFPIVKLNISGTIAYSDKMYTVITTNEDLSTVTSQNFFVTTNGNTIKGAPLKKISINNKYLIKLLNASPAVTNTMTDLGLPNQIPAGSYFIWDLDPIDFFYDSDTNFQYDVDTLIVTNKNGFSFELTGFDPDVTNNDLGFYNYGSVTIDQVELIGTFTKNVNTDAGSESDLTGVEIYFNDYNGNFFDSYGNGALDWHYAAREADSPIQKTTLNAKLPAPNGYSGSVNYNDAMTLSNFKASGSGKGIDPVYLNPLYIWWSQNQP